MLMFSGRVVCRKVVGWMFMCGIFLVCLLGWCVIGVFEEKFLYGNMV